MSTKLILGLAAATAVAVSAACNDESCRSRAVNMLNMDGQLEAQLADSIMDLDITVADDLADFLEAEAFEVGAGKIKFKRVLKKVGRAAEKAAKNYARNLLGGYEMEEEEAEAFEMGKIRFKKIVKKVGRVAEKVAKNYARNVIGAFEVEDLEADAFEMGVSKIKIGRILEKIAKETARELLNGYEMEEEEAEAFEMGRRKIKIGKILEKIAKETARELLGGYEMQEEEAEAFEMEKIRIKIPKIKIGPVIKEIARQTALELLSYELGVEDVEDAEVEEFQMGSRWKKLRRKVREAAKRAAKKWALERLGAYELEEDLAEADLQTGLKKQIKPYRPRPLRPTTRPTGPVRPRPVRPGRFPSRRFGRPSKTKDIRRRFLDWRAKRIQAEE